MVSVCLQDFVLGLQQEKEVRWTSPRQSLCGDRSKLYVYKDPRWQRLSLGRWGGGSVGRGSVGPESVTAGSITLVSAYSVGL